MYVVIYGNVKRNIKQYIIYDIQYAWQRTLEGNISVNVHVMY